MGVGELMRWLVVLMIIMLVACGNDVNTIKEERENFEFNERIDTILGFDALFTVWEIEDEFLEEKDADTDVLFRFTDTYLDKYESLNEQEKAIVMKTSGMIRKFLENEYKNIEEFNEDKQEFYKVLETGVY